MANTAWTPEAKARQRATMLRLKPWLKRRSKVVAHEALADALLGFKPASNW